MSLVLLLLRLTNARVVTLSDKHFAQQALSRQHPKFSLASITISTRDILYIEDITWPRIDTKCLFVVKNVDYFST